MCLRKMNEEVHLVGDGGRVVDAPAVASVFIAARWTPATSSGTTASATSTTSLPSTTSLIAFNFSSECPLQLILQDPGESLRSSKESWMILENHERSWTILNDPENSVRTSEESRMIQENLQRFWKILDNFERSWKILEDIQRILDDPGESWTILKNPYRHPKNPRWSWMILKYPEVSRRILEDFKGIRNDSRES